MLANLTFGLPAVRFSTTTRADGHLWLGEVVATAGLLLLIFPLARTGRAAGRPGVGVGLLAALYPDAGRAADNVVTAHGPAVDVGGRP